PREPLQPNGRERLLAQLDKSQTTIERAACATQEDLFAQILGYRNRVNTWQRQRAQHRTVGGEHRCNVERARRLPGDGLTVATVPLSMPFEHSKEIELDVRVRLIVALSGPG